MREIPPPKRTLADLERYLREIAPLVSQDEEGRPTSFGLAIHRWKMRLEDARLEGLTYEQAERHWKAAIEREDAALKEAMDYGVRTASRALRERDAPRQGARSKRRYGLEGTNAIHDFADELAP
jgi:hypothetical protein